MWIKGQGQPVKNKNLNSNINVFIFLLLGLKIIRKTKPSKLRQNYDNF